MNVGGGLTFLVHVIIIIIHWILKKPLHFIIVLLVLIFFYTQLFLLFKESSVNSNLSFFKSYSTCKDNYKVVPSKKYIIFRLDDLQSSYLNDLSIKMIDEGIKRKIPFTLGIIPLNLLNDSSSTKYLKQNKCNLEIAQYGFNNRNDVPEFQNLSESAAEKKLVEGLKILNQYTNKKIITFIAPDNIYSIGTVLSVGKKQFKIISGEGDAFFDYKVSTYDSKNAKLNSLSSIITKSNEEASQKGFSIIMLHPQDYLDDFGNLDSIKYNDYIKLLDRLQDEGFAFTTMSDYYYYLSKQGLKTDLFYKSIKEPEFYKIKAQSNDVIKL